MQKRPLNILTVDDDAADARILERLLGRIPDFPFAFHHCASTDEARRDLAEREVDLVFLDYRLGMETGLAILEDIQEEGWSLPVIMLTGEGDERVAVEAMKRGAQDYLAKSDATPESLRRAIINATERVWLRRRLAEKQEEMETFARTAAHDLKAPLRTVKGFLDLLREDLAEGNHERIDEYVTTVSDRADQMTRLIDDLLAYTRAGQSVGGFEPVDLDACVRHVLDVLAKPLAAANVHVEVGELPTVLGDEAAISQLFQNLIDNACKFRRDESPRIEIGARSLGVAHEIYIRDHGIGIAEEHFTKIFEPLSRLHGRSAFEGSGIGLATAKKIVGRHYGRIWLESVPDVGTTFYFTLPACVPSPEEVRATLSV